MHIKDNPACCCFQLPAVPGQPGTSQAAAAALEHDRLAVDRQEREQPFHFARYSAKL
jgi:hypothetical protein